MYDQPSVRELVQAVKNFVDGPAMTELQGRSAFHARVASNVLGTILRDLEQRTDAEKGERTRLQALLDMPGEHDLSVLNSVLTERIRNRQLGPQSDELMKHLKITAIAQVQVDQPKYSGLLQALKEP